MRRIWPWLWVSSLVLSAQVEPVEQEVRVRLRDVRVHVLDADGQRVTGLRPERFELFTGGQAREISFFEEVVLEGVAVATNAGLDGTFVAPHNQEPGCLVFVIESGNMSKAIFRKCIDAVEGFVRNQLPPGVMLKIVQIEEEMIHLSPFTQNRQRALAGLAKASYRGRLWKQLNSYEREIVTQIVDPKGGTGLASRESAFTIINSSVRLKASAKDRSYRGFYANMMLLARILKPIPGSKSVFLLTGGSFLEEDGIYRGTTPLAREMGRVYNEANTTIYAILQEPMVPLSERLLAVANQRFGPDNNSLSYRTLQNASIFPPTQGTALSYNTVFENRTQLATGPTFAAGETGGLLFSSTDNDTFADRLPALFQSANHYYRLGFTFLLGEEDGAAELELELEGRKKNGWELHYGRNYQKATDLERGDESERALEFEAMLLLGGIPRNELNSISRFHFFKAPGAGYRIPVYVEAPSSAKARAGYEIGFAALGPEGELLDLSLARSKRTPEVASLLFYDVLISEKRPSTLRSAILNRESGRFSFREEAVEPPAPKGSYLSEIVLGGSGEGAILVPMNQYRESDHERDRLRQREDPFLLGETRFVPGITDRYPAGAAARFFFQLEGVDQPDHRFELKLKLTQEGRDLPAKAAIPHVLNPAKALYYFAGSFETAHLSPGKYELVIRLVHPQTGRILQRTKTFSITGPNRAR